MNQIDKLRQYCQEMFFDYEIEDNVLSLDDKLYRIIEDEDRMIFDEEMNFLPVDKLGEGEVGYVYEFGGRWYTQIYGEDVSLSELKYIGKANQKLPTESFLGIRSGYELMNGMGLYDEWVQKAKFLEITALGICERKTLGGVLAFQNECTRNGIKPVTGITIPIEGKNNYDIKLYAKNFQGWLNLLKFNGLLNVNQEHRISENFLLENSNDLYIIADPKSMPYESVQGEIKNRIDFYQLDTVRFLNEEQDIWYLENLEKFITGELSPISITDAFYLEQRDYLTREVLWAINKAFDDKTDNQFFKNKTQYAVELINLFEKENTSWNKLFKEALANEKLLVENCNFKYDTNTRHLPKYEMTEEERMTFKSNEELFIHLITKGFKERNFTEPQQYIDRLKEEIAVLKMGDVIDYFLVLHDIMNYAKEEKFLTGIGRGSAGGSLVAYLLGIIAIDPLEFDLLFERFLNSGRMGELQDRPYYTFVGEDGKEIGLAEGATVRILRKGQEKILLVHEIEEGDEILKY